MKKTSGFTINGSPVNVTIESPDNIVEAIGLERANHFLRSFGHAHWCQSAIKSAFGKAADKRSAEDKELVKRVENGTPIDFLDFVPDPRGQAVSKADLAVAEAAYDKYMNTDEINDEMLSASYRKVGLVYDNAWTRAKDEKAGKAAFVAMHANKKRVERSLASKALA